MNIREIITLVQITRGAQLYGVRFINSGYTQSDGKTYTYKETSGLGLGIGDLVVVESRDAVGLAEVVMVGLEPSTVTDLGKIRHIVAKVDMDGHHAKLAAENVAGQAFALAEINERLASVRHGIGAERFDSVAKLLDVTPKSVAPDTGTA